jgi:hypothetical protein
MIASLATKLILFSPFIFENWVTRSLSCLKSKIPLQDASCSNNFLQLRASIHLKQVFFSLSFTSRNQISYIVNLKGNLAQFLPFIF